MKIESSTVMVKEKPHTIFSIMDFVYLVEEIMGEDSARWIEQVLEQAEQEADLTQAKAQTDEAVFEEELEGTTRALMDIVNEVDELLKMERFSRKAVLTTAENIKREAYNFI